MWAWRFGAMVPVIVSLALLSACGQTSSYTEEPAAAATDVYDSAAPAAATTPTPAAASGTTGVLWRQGGKPLAPFEVVTQSGRDYYVKMVNLSSGQTELAAYIRGGEHFETLMPLSTYELRYASGTAWYGEQNLFGEETSYFRAEDPMHFTEENDGYAGYTVELILQEGGNLETQPIGPGEF